MNAPFQPRRDELFAHQEEGARWLAQHHRAGLFDDMGLGKTATAITALDHLNARRGIVICNSTLKENWKREIQKWSRIPGRRIRKGNDLSDLMSWLKYYYDILIFSYEMAVRWKPIIMKQCGILDFIIIDESHKVKNPDAKRTKALKGRDCDGIGAICQFSSHVWELTGTPIPNDPLDIYTFLKFCGCLGSMQRHTFTSEYFFSQPGRYSSRQTVRPEKQKELQNLVRDVSLRRTGVLDLPPILVTNRFLDGETSKVAAYMRDHPGLDDAIIAALNGGNLNLIDTVHVMELRRLIGEAKALPFSHYLIDLMQAGLKSPVVFAWHKNVIKMVQETLEKHGYKIGRIDGSVTERRRQLAVDGFQDGSLDGIVCNIQAGGEGITLTRGSHLFMLESGFTPKDNSQPIKRIHRIGQQKHTRAEFITLAGSFDENIIGIVQDKVEAIFQIDGQNMIAAPAA